MRTEKEKMMAGEVYNPYDEELWKLHEQALELVGQFNQTSFVRCKSHPEILRQLLPHTHETLTVQPPFFCDFGFMIRGGENGFINYNCVILDTAPITLGKNVLIGPNVQIYAPMHPINYRERATGVEHGEPVTIGDDCWIGGSAVICPGVTIGHRCVIAAGAVVTKDIPDDCMAAGVPAKVIRKL